MKLHLSRGRTDRVERPGDVAADKASNTAEVRPRQERRHVGESRERVGRKSQQGKQKADETRGGWHKAIFSRRTPNRQNNALPTPQASTRRIRNSTREEDPRDDLGNRERGARD